jgi:hypothetical protein
VDAHVSLKTLPEQELWQLELSPCLWQDHPRFNTHTHKMLLQYAANNEQQMWKEAFVADFRNPSRHHNSWCPCQGSNQKLPIPLRRVSVWGRLTQRYFVMRRSTRYFTSLLCSSKPVPCLAKHSALKMGIIYSSETPPDLQRTTRDLGWENRKSCAWKTVLEVTSIRWPTQRPCWPLLTASTDSPGKYLNGFHLNDPTNCENTLQSR